MAGLPGGAADPVALPGTGPAPVSSDGGNSPDLLLTTPPFLPVPGRSGGVAASGAEIGAEQRRSDDAVASSGDAVSRSGADAVVGARAAPGGARLNHRRAVGEQELWLGFGGQADQPWLRLLEPGFRHCFAALRDAGGWTVLDPLSGRLLVTRLEVPAEFDLPAFWRRSGHHVLGPYKPEAPRPGWPWPAPANCVGVVRALMGPGAPMAVTPYGLYRRLIVRDCARLKNKTFGCVKIFLTAMVTRR